MSNNYILHTSQEIGIDRIGCAIVFGKILTDSINNKKSLEQVADTMLMITDIEKFAQIVRDYTNYINPHIQ